MQFIGEFAALITAITFAGTSTFFTLAGSRVGSVVVNRTRLIIALFLLLITHQLFLGSLLPLDAEPSRWGWLILSGIIGLSIGDAALFQSFLIIGPRIAMLLMSLAPVLAAILGWIFLGEVLIPGQILGILLTVSGVGWVIAERESDDKKVPEPRGKKWFIGILFGLGGATGQALGAVLSKFGLVGDFSPISANLIRMLAATAAIWAWTIFQGQAPLTVSRLFENRKAALQILGGAIIGPYIGVSLSLLAFQRTEVGIASTIIATTPIFLLPVGYLVFKERVTKRAVTGTIIAIAGIALLFLN